MDLKTNMNSIRLSVEKREVERRGVRGGGGGDAGDADEEEDIQMIGLSSNSGIDVIVEAPSPSSSSLPSSPDSSSIQSSDKIGVDDAIATSSSSNDIYVIDAVTPLATTSTEVSIAPSSPSSSADEVVLQSPTAVITVLWLKQELERALEENEALRCRIEALESEVGGYTSLKQSLKELIKD